MFPNLRLMIVAVLASILGISCALGLFAEFRVSHDSFLRESNASAPLQLGAGDTTPGRLVNTAAPFEFRFQALPPASETAETPDQAVVIATPQPAPSPPGPVEAAGTSETTDQAIAIKTPQPVPPPPSQPESPAASV